MKLSELRAVVVRFRVIGSQAGQRTWHKIAQSGQVEPVTDHTTAVQWLEAHGYRQHGAAIGAVRELAVFWLKENDQPENLTEALGERVTPYTCAWYTAEGKIGTTRTAAQIRRDRARKGRTLQDLQFVERPTHAALMHAYGLA